MKICILIAELERVKEQYGDLECYYVDIENGPEIIEDVQCRPDTWDGMVVLT